MLEFWPILVDQVNGSTHCWNAMRLDFFFPLRAGEANKMTYIKLRAKAKWIGSNTRCFRTWKQHGRETCFPICFSSCRLGLQVPTLPGTQLRCGPTSSWLISPLPGFRCFKAIVFYVFQSGFLQKWHTLAFGGWWSLSELAMLLQVELRTRARCSVPGSWTMQARDISWHLFAWWQHHKMYPTSQCQPLNDEDFLPPTAIILDLTAGSL